MSRKEFFYHADKGECDFIIGQGFEITEVYQVCVVIENKETKSLEINGLLDALQSYFYAGFRRNLID